MELYSRILRLKQVKERVGLSRSQIYALMKHGAFSHSISLGARAVGWLEADIEAWIKNRISIQEGGSNSARLLTPPVEPPKKRARSIGPEMATERNFLSSRGEAAKK